MVLIGFVGRILALGLASIAVGATQVPLGLPVSVRATGTRTALTPEFSASVERYLARNGVPGLSVGVVYLNGSNVETEFETWGNRTEDGDEMTKETLFYIGSCSKAFLATSVGILIDDFAKGKNKISLPPGVEAFTWRTKIRDLLPNEWKLKDAWASKNANLIDILSHVSGLPRHDLAYGGSDSQADVVRRLRYLEPVFEFREQYHYNNHMYMLGAHIVERYSGGAFHTFVEERILKPLEMNSTVYYAQSIPSHRPLAQSFTNNGRRIPTWFENESVSTLLAGAGGIISNTIDMTKWLAMLINDGVNPHTDQVVVPKDVIRAVTTAYAIASGQGLSIDDSILGYGMGWGRAAYKGHEIVSHNGGLPGFLTETMFFPWDKFGVNVLMNNDFVSEVPPTVAKHVVDNVLGLPHSEPDRMNPVFSAENVVAPTLAPLEALPSTPCRKSTERPALALSKYEGVYTNPAFGPISLCSPTNTTSYCTDLLSVFSSVNATSKPALYAFWDRVWTRHIQLLPVEDNEFNVKISNIFPHGYGKDSRPFVTATSLHDVPIRAVFDVHEGEVKGLALPNGFEPRPVGSIKRQGSLKEGALVYFHRV